MLSLSFFVMIKDPELKLMWLTVNRNCNFQCSWCYAADGKYEYDCGMDISLASDLVDLVADIGVKRLYIIGGEPTLWPHLLTLNEKMNLKGVKSILVTNGYLFSLDSFFDEYKNNSNTHIGVSFKAFNKKTFIQNTGLSDFDKLTLGLRRIFENQSDSIASFVYSKSLLLHIVDMVKYAMDCGSYGVSVNFCAPTIHMNGEVEYQEMIEPEILVKNILSTYEEVHSITKGRIIYVIKQPLCMWPLDFIRTLKSRHQISTTCHLQHKSGGIFNTDGSLLICNHLYGYPVGKYLKDFNSSDSLVEFFKSSHVKKTFALAKAYPSKRCIDCDLYKDCAGGCPLLWSVYKPENIITGC